MASSFSRFGISGNSLIILTRHSTGASCGQPSVVYRVAFTLDGGADVQTATDPWGYGSIDGQQDGAVHDMDGTISVTEGRLLAIQACEPAYP